MAEIGYLSCPDCGKGTCRVSIDRNKFAYYVCDRCRTQHMTRSGEGSDGLRARMTPADNAETETEDD